jgi:hypothetical protein
MTSLVATVSAERPRVRANDRSMFTSARKSLEAHLQPLPDWFPQGAGYDALRPERRVEDTYQAALALGFLRIKRRPEPCLVATSLGDAWLGLAEGERLRQLATYYRALWQLEGDVPIPIPSLSVDAPVDGASAKAGKPAAGDDIDDLDDDALSLIPQASPLSGAFAEPANWAGQLALRQAFDSLRGRGYFVIDAFVRYHSESMNPWLKSTDPPALFQDWRWRRLTDEEYIECWGDALLRFLLSRLFAFGGATVGQDDSGRICFDVNDVGAYLLGVATDADFGSDEVLPGQLVVQPNFEVVFLAPAPALEANVARFAERIGRSVGTLFRLTRAAAFQAASVGLTIDVVLETLGAALSKPIPTNVEHELHSWFGQCCRAKLETATTIRSPDAETAKRILSKGGSGLALISPTVVEITDGEEKKRRTEVLQRLRKHGIFIDDRLPPKPRAKRRSDW